jgi:hypothetical protein
MKNKTYIDAVKMMREIRDKHHAEYSKNPELREKRLAAIRKRFTKKTKTKITASH